MSIPLVEHYEKLDAKSEENEKLRQDIAQMAIQNHRYYENLQEVEKFLDTLFLEPKLSKLFFSDLIEVRCDICRITECSTRGDHYECLRLTGPAPILDNNQTGSDKP